MFVADTSSIPILVAMVLAHVSAGLGHGTAAARTASAGPGTARALLQVAPSERARYR